MLNSVFLSHLLPPISLYIEDKWHQEQIITLSLVITDLLLGIMLSTLHLIFHLLLRIILQEWYCSILILQMRFLFHSYSKPVSRCEPSSIVNQIHTFCLLYSNYQDGSKQQKYLIWIKFSYDCLCLFNCPGINEWRLWGIQSGQLERKLKHHK